MSFPLHRLQSSAQIHILRFLDPLELVAVSLSSTRVKNQVKSLKTTAQKLSIIVHNMSIHLKIMFNIQSIYLSFLKPISLQMVPSSIQISISDPEWREIKWLNSEVSFEKWVNICNYIFKYSDGCKLSVQGDTEIISMESLKRAFPFVRSLTITETSSDYGQKAFETFIPVINTLRYDFFEWPTKSQEFSIQNFENMTLRLPLRQKTLLDDMLLLNAQFIDMTHAVPFRITDMNRLIKLWMRGALPRATYLRLTFKRNQVFDVGVVVKGIPHQIISDDVESRIKGVDGEEVIRGGFEIRKKDKRSAIVKITQFGQLHFFGLNAIDYTVVIALLE